jgi:hypothetical protein
MFGMPNLPADPRWVYDDPSGLPEEVTVTLCLPNRCSSRSVPRLRAAA